MITLSNVIYRYRDIEALSGITLEIGKGEAVALIGPNGSGKSTLLKLLNGIVFADSGTYAFEGSEINRKAMQDTRFMKTFHKKVGFIFQNPDVQLFCSSVYEEVAFAPVQMGFSPDETRQRVEDCLKLLGIESLRDRVPYHLSGGEKKKVAIASVLASNPDVLILDEPMNGLDPRSKRFLRDFLGRMNEAGKTIICATHDFEYVEGIFSRAVVLSDSHKICRDDSYERVTADRQFLLDYNIV